MRSCWEGRPSGKLQGSKCNSSIRVLPGFATANFVVYVHWEKNNENC
jgi:hypothetical protein